MNTLTPSTIINEWTMEFYSPTEEEWVDYGYWTISDQEDQAIELLLKDEDNQVDYLSCQHRTWTYEQFQRNQGPDALHLIRDLQNETTEA